MGKKIDGTFHEIELADDLQDFLRRSNDVEVADELKDEIFDYQPHQLLSITMRIKPPVEIVGVRAVDDVFVDDAFPSLDH